MNEIKRLDGLCVGESAIVSELCCEGGMRRRLLDVGLAPGTTVSCIGESPLGDPCAYLVRGCRIAIRRRDAHSIVIK